IPSPCSPTEERDSPRAVRLHHRTQNHARNPWLHHQKSIQQKTPQPPRSSSPPPSGRLEISTQARTAVGNDLCGVPLPKRFGSARINNPGRMKLALSTPCLLVPRSPCLPK